MEVEKVADMEEDKVADMEEDKVADMVADKKEEEKKCPTWRWTWWPTR